MRIGTLLCATLGLACSEERQEPAATPSPPPPPSGYEPIELESIGSVRGRVIWEGAVPDPTMLPVELHAAECGSEREAPVLRLGPRRGVADVVLWVEGVRAGRALPQTPAVIRAVDCAFSPHVAAIAVGTDLEVRSDAPILHNVHAHLARETWFSLGLPSAGASHVVRAAEPGIARLVDDAGHTWMHGWVHVFEHPYFAVSDANGEFRIEGLPPGRYTLRAWHEGVNVIGSDSGRPTYSRPIVLSRSLTISADHETGVDFALSSRIAEDAGD